MRANRRNDSVKSSALVALSIVACWTLAFAGSVLAAESASQHATPPAEVIAPDQAQATNAEPTSEMRETSREARLEQALGRYAHALSETDRDARLADFARAEQAFAALAADGIDTPALWTNLANAALQAQHPGQAVVAYHHALRLDPSDAKARQNLNHIRSRLPSWVPHPEATDGAQSFQLAQIPPDTRRLAAAICFGLMAVFVAASVRRKQGAWRGLALVAGIAWLVALGSTLLEARNGPRVVAVTTAEESFARSADSSLASLAYPEPLPPGVEVELLEDRADWVRARLANGRDIWLRASNVTRVSPRMD